jgi:hypothetical protein
MDQPDCGRQLSRPMMLPWGRLQDIRDHATREDVGIAEISRHSSRHCALDGFALW